MCHAQPAQRLDYVCAVAAISGSRKAGVSSTDQLCGLQAVRENRLQVPSDYQLSALQTPALSSSSRHGLCCSFRKPQLNAGTSAVSRSRLSLGPAPTSFDRGSRPSASHTSGQDMRSAGLARLRRIPAVTPAGDSKLPPACGKLVSAGCRHSTGLGVNGEV